MERHNGGKTEGHRENNIWELIKMSLDKRAIDVKWIFKLKLEPNGEIARHKAKLVARGFI